MTKQHNTSMGRFYELPNGLMVPSVTHILSVFNKPALVNWAANQEHAACVQAAAGLYEDTLKLPAPLSGIAFVTTLESRIGKEKAHKKELEKAADLGTQVHKKIEWTLRKMLNYPVGPEPQLQDKALWAFMAWEDWWREAGLRPLHIEQVVYSMELGFAGTEDLYAVFERPYTLDGVTFATGDEVVVDWKTGKAIYAEAHLQNVSYQHAVREMKHGNPSGGIIVRLPKVDTDPEFEARVVGPYLELFPAFLAAKEAWKWWHAEEVKNRAAYDAKRKAAKDSATTAQS